MSRRFRFALSVDRLATVALGLAVGILLAYLALALVIRGSETSVGEDLSAVIDCGDADWAASAGISVEADTGCPNATEVTIAVREVDHRYGPTLTLNSTLYPSGTFGGNVADGAWALQSLIVSDDAVGSNEWLVRSNSLVGTHEVEIAMTAAQGISAYPFDAYVASWIGVVDDAVSGERVPVVQTASQSNAPGYDVTIHRGQIEGSVDGAVVVNPFGRFSYDMQVVRDPAVKFQILLLVTATVIGAVAAVLLSILVLTRRRPPSIAALSWLATFLFALLEVRRNYPGNPPVGVTLDTAITVPVVTLLMGLIVVNAAIWLRRDDWDLRNRREIGST